MPVSKLKNLAILILLLANLALLALLIPSRIAAREQTDSLANALSELCESRDVSLSPDAVPDTMTLYALELGEDPAADLRAATALLGTEVLAQDDSTRYLSLYSSSAGTCEIHRDGTLKARLQDQSETGDLSAGARRTLEAMGFAVHSLGEPQRLRAGVYTLTATQAVLGVPVLSGDLTLTYSNSRLTELSGLFFTGANVLSRVSDTASISAADAVVAFLAARYDLGWVGSAILSLSQGYIRSETAAAAAVHLTPVWLLETDTGAFLVNGITSEVRIFS